MSVELIWLPQGESWAERMRELRSAKPAEAAWTELERLSEARLGPEQMVRLNREMERTVAAVGVPQRLERVRVALLGSATTHHLLPAIHVAGLRRGMWIEVYEGGYGQYLQEVLQPPETLRAFAPEIVVFALDAEHLEQMASGARDQMELCWRSARKEFGATVVQQTAMVRDGQLMGSNEHRLAESGTAGLLALNHWMRGAADAAGVHLLALDQYVAWGGLEAWHDPGLWHLAKQEVHPGAAAMYGELLARVVGAARGRSRKCLVLDLDHTLWHGVAGEDGTEGIRVGQGSAAGEAHLAFQRYCAGLRRRGVLLAVCSKNEEAVVRSIFAARPDMPLGLGEFACVRANWRDKASNLREIATALNLGLDALVFADDNPAERALVRRELPEVAVPEMGDDPAQFVRVLSRAGYFESLGVTQEDRIRTVRHRPETEEAVGERQVVDLAGYLASLKMRLSLRPFAEAGLDRIVQLANKTNQFNLTTLRVGAEEVRQWMADPCTLSWQGELRDRFGEHGVITLAAGRCADPRTFRLGLWVMSCRVFGREVEQACLNAMIKELAVRDVETLVAPYRPTAKNGLLRERLAAMGFEADGRDGDGELWAISTRRPPLASAVVTDRVS